LSRKLADLVILDADPLADVVNLSRIHRVIKDGKVFVPEDLIGRSQPRAELREAASRPFILGRPAAPGPAPTARA